MTIEKLEKGNSLKHRIEDLEKVKCWLSSGNYVHLLESGMGAVDSARIPDNMHPAFRELFSKEIERLKEEFEQLQFKRGIFGCSFY